METADLDTTLAVTSMEPPQSSVTRGHQHLAVNLTNQGKRKESVHIKMATGDFKRHAPSQPWDQKVATHKLEASCGVK